MATTTLEDPAISSCPHFGYAWKTDPQAVPKHIKCLAVIHHFAAVAGVAQRVEADQWVENYMQRFGVRSTRDHEIQTLIHKGYIQTKGDHYVFDKDKVDGLLAPYMRPCRG